MPDTRSRIQLTAEIVSAYVANNSMPRGDLSSFVNAVHSAIVNLSAGAGPETRTAIAPAVPMKKSVTHDYMICLEDGRKFKSLRRHLRTEHGLSPEAYREKWGLPVDYPMVSPAYAKARSALAISSGLGKQRGRKPGHKSKGAKPVGE
jgi:predicted transcriptional regulator